MQKSVTRLFLMCLPVLAAFALARGTAAPWEMQLLLAASSVYLVAACVALFLPASAFQKTGLVIAWTGVTLMWLSSAGFKPPVVWFAYGLALPAVGAYVAYWPRLEGRHVAQTLAVLGVLALLFPGTCFWTFRDVPYHP
ncbi:MAG: hypothetical protein JWM80_1663 [Cyanobacteria bacterium RYN_339]|nr:hypothetical protein [Cyanobacteria bacterium RYN_339]